MWNYQRTRMKIILKSYWGEKSEYLHRNHNCWYNPFNSNKNYQKTTEYYFQRSERKSQLTLNFTLNSTIFYKCALNPKYQGSNIKIICRKQMLSKLPPKRYSEMWTQKEDCDNRSKRNIKCWKKIFLKKDGSKILNNNNIM